MPISNVYLQDCLEYMKGVEDNFFELAIVDPPYGIGISGQKLSCKGKKSDRKLHKEKQWDKAIPDKQYFRELFRISTHQIIWGANYFVEHLQEGHKGWIVWDKMQHGLTMSDCELAYSSFDSATRIWYKNRCILKQEGNTIHPTQKPVALYKWLLNNYAKQGDKIFDSHMGSQSSRIACHQLGFDFWGCELDEDYFKQGCERFEKETAQDLLFPC